MLVEPLELIFAEHVDPAVLSVLSREHSAQTPGVPLIWMLSYSAAGALQNIRYFENGVRHCKLEFPVRVFLSNWTDAIVVSFVPLEAIKEPHIQEWHVTFYEVPVEEAKARLTQFPKFPYDGRNADLVRAEMIAGGDIQALLKRSADHLRSRGVPLIPKF